MISRLLQLRPLPGAKRVLSDKIRKLRQQNVWLLSVRASATSPRCRALIGLRPVPFRCAALCPFAGKEQPWCNSRRVTSQCRECILQFSRKRSSADGHRTSRAGPNSVAWGALCVAARLHLKLQRPCPAKLCLECNYVGLPAPTFDQPKFSGVCEALPLPGYQPGSPSPGNSFGSRATTRGRNRTHAGSGWKVDLCSSAFQSIQHHGPPTCCN